MAKCKLCKISIPDGTEYCNNCQDKENAKANESYLDSLLNSVKNTVPSTESIYKKKTDSYTNIPELNSSKNPEEQDEQEEPEEQDSGIYNIDLSDIEDFDQFYGSEDLNDIAIGDKELFGENLSDIFEDKSIITEKQETALQEEVTPEQEPEPEAYSIVDSQSDNPSNEEELIPLDSIADNFTPEEISEAQEEEEESELDEDINDLLNSLDVFQDNDDNTKDDENRSISDGGDKTKSDQIEDFEPIQADEDDFLNLLNQIDDDDPVAGDVKAINDLLNGRPVKEPLKSNVPSDVGEVFSDALKVVSSLNDPSINEEELLAKIPDKKESKAKKEKKQKKASTKEVKGNTEDELLKALGEKPKKGLLKRIFGNVVDKNAAKNKANELRFKPEDSAAAKETSKKAKGKKGTSPKDQEEEELTSAGRGKGKASAAKEDIKEIKKDKKDKKKKTKEIIQVIDEIEEDEGRINRLGASVVFVFFGLLVLLLLVGTNVVSYTLSIQHATNYFGKQKYNQAYNEVYGIDIKDEDIVIYDKIMTVMFVNKQLNSYNSYYSLGEYPEALDSLLKGLSRYDKYIELATMLGIQTDLNYVRSQILAELKSVFNLSEDEAIKIISTDDMEEYSLEVYNVVLERINN